MKTARRRAAFIPGRWLEFIDKDSGQNLLPAGGIAFTAGPIETRGDALIFARTENPTASMTSETLAPRPEEIAVGPAIATSTPEAWKLWK